MSMSVLVPSTRQELDHVRSLMRTFIAWHKERHTQDIHLIDGYFDAEAFEHELESLPGKYSPPKGKLLLASIDGVPVGCVALRQIDSSSCEMKRMFVDPEFHGKGAGYALADAVINSAKELGYRLMRLDTSFRQNEAMALYASLGFKKIEPYYDLPEDLKGWLVFMELAL